MWLNSNLFCLFSVFRESTDHRAKYAVIFFHLARVATSYKSRDHAKFVVISGESHAIMQPLHYAGKQKVLRHVSLNICQLTEVIKVFSSVSAVSYDENL